MKIDREAIFDECLKRNYSVYDEALIWETVNIICDEVERELKK